MLIKSLTLWQPWASFMALGLKKNETRDKGTSYRGPLAIHAAKRTPWDEIPPDVLRLAIDKIGPPKRWPLGKVVCVVNLTNIFPSIREPLDLFEAMLGNYARGRKIWYTDMLQVFNEPIPATGHQWLWEWEWNKKEV